MKTRVDIRALAKLSRLEVSDEELAKLEKEIPNILAFVETIQGVSAHADTEKIAELRNVMRADDSPSGGPHEGGVYTEKLLKAAPKQKDGRVVVKQVVKRDASR